MDLLYFKGGPSDGEMVRWNRRTAGPIPPYWNHVERTARPVDLDEAGNPPDGVELCGHGRDAKGRKTYFTEDRIWHRYKLGVRVGPMGSAQYEPAGSPVPLYWDGVQGKWESPDDYTEDIQTERFEPPVLSSPPPTEDPDDGGS